MSEWRSGIRNVPLLCTSLAVAFSLMTFLGWITGMPLLASIRAKYIPMAPSTALCFSLLGCGMVVHLLRPRLGWAARLPAVLVLVMVTAKIVEIFGGYHFGIDAWFVRNPELFGGVPTGRMSPMTAATFVIAAAGLLALTWHRTEKWACPLGAAATVTSVIVIVGYCYGTPLLYGGTVIPVALSTALGFFLSGVAVMTAAGPGGWPLRAFHGSATRAAMLRAFVPIIVGAALVNGWVATVLLERGNSNPAVVSALGAIVFAVLVTWLVSQVSESIGGRIDRAEMARNAAQAELLALNAELETRVEDRTRELRGKNEQMREDLQMAKELQAALLPSSFPTVPPNAGDGESALRFLSLYYPTGDVSGDFFSAFPVGENAVGVLICDVMGHGVRSALITSMIRGLVEEHSSAAGDPGELLTRINHALTLILQQAGITMFATCFYVVADVGRGELRFANAGHPSALHIRCGDGPAAEKLEGTARRGPAMGLIAGAKYATVSKPVSGGDMILLFTDGLFEVEDASGALFSEAQLQETAARHAALAPDDFLARVMCDVREFACSDTFEDDVCVIGIKVRHLEREMESPDALASIDAPGRGPQLTAD